MMKLIPYLFVLAIVLVIIYMNKIRIKSDPKFMAMKLPGDRIAVTMPPFGVYVQPGYENDEMVKKHEMCHWRQYQDKGLIKYYGDYFKLKAKTAYDDNPMERECFAAENI